MARRSKVYARGGNGLTLPSSAVSRSLFLSPAINPSVMDVLFPFHASGNCVWFNVLVESLANYGGCLMSPPTNQKGPSRGRT